jgi:hypothetical protein
MNDTWLNRSKQSAWIYLIHPSRRSATLKPENENGKFNRKVPLMKLLLSPIFMIFNVFDV